MRLMLRTIPGTTGLVLALLVLPILLWRTTSETVAKPESRAPNPVCPIEISHPLQVEIIPMGSPRPGETLSFRVLVTAGRLLDDVSVSVVETPGIEILGKGRERIALLAEGDALEQVFTLRLPADRSRRTVEIVAQGHVDGFPVTRGATLNVNYDEEPYRMVTRKDGTAVRQVTARRIG